MSCNSYVYYKTVLFFFKLMEHLYLEHFVDMVVFTHLVPDQQSHLTRAVCSRDDERWRRQIEKDFGIKGLL